MKKFDEKIDSMQAFTSQQETVVHSRSYANVLSDANKPSVIIKPKDSKQKASDTCDDIKKQFNRKELNACEIKKLYGGGVIVRCENNTDTRTMKMKQMVEQKFGDKYDIRLPALLKPRVKILNVDDVDEDDIIDELKSRNDLIMDSAEITVKKILDKKSNRFVAKDVILEVDYQTFERMMEAGRVKIGWRSCKVVHHVHITRCFKCCGFGHIAKDCKNKLACSTVKAME